MAGSARITSRKWAIAPADATIAPGSVQSTASSDSFSPRCQGCLYARCHCRPPRRQLVGAQRALSLPLLEGCVPQTATQSRAKPRSTVSRCGQPTRLAPTAPTGDHYQSRMPPSVPANSSAFPVENHFQTATMTPCICQAYWTHYDERSQLADLHRCRGSAGDHS